MAESARTGGLRCGLTSCCQHYLLMVPCATFIRPAPAEEGGEMVSDRSSSNAGVRIVCRAVRGKGVAADTLLTTQCNTKVQTLLMLVGASRLCGRSPAISECAGMGLMGDG